MPDPAASRYKSAGHATSLASPVFPRSPRVTARSCKRSRKPWAHSLRPPGWGMVENHDAIELDFHEGPHDLRHFVVAVVHQRLDKVGQRRADVAEVDLPEFFRAP